MLSTLPTPIRVSPADLLSIPSIDAIIAKITETVDTDLQFDIDNLQKTHLLRNRLETVDGSLSRVTRRRRHYLMMVAVPAYRKSLTRLLLGDHTLSVERLRYPSRYRLTIPRAQRLCRFCLADVEDEVHALLICEAQPTLVDLREQFLSDAFLNDRELEAAAGMLSSHDFLCRLVSSRKIVARLAKYVHEVLIFFDRFQRYIAPGFHTP